MVSLEKKEIFAALLRVCKTLENIVANPNMKIIHFLTRDYIEFDANQYYKDYKIFVNLISLRILSYCEDSLLNIIANDDIDLIGIKETIFINSGDANRFSNKQIIKFIRNAVSHSDENKELFKISPNGRFIEIDLKNTKPIPFHIKISSENLLKMACNVLRSAKGSYCTLLNTNENKIVRIYYKNNLHNKITIPNDIMLGSDQYLSKIIDFLEKNNIEHEIKEYKLISEQIELIKEFGKKFSEIITNYPEQRNTLYQTIYDSVIPLANEKIYSLFSYLQLYILLYNYPDYTFAQFRSEIINGYLKAIQNKENSSESNNNENYNNMSELAMFNYDFQVENEMNLEHYFQTLKCLFSMTNVTINEFFTYFFSCLCSENEIEINGEKYEKENIRDAFVHGRYFSDINGNIICCDANNGRNNDYNFYWIKTLPLKDTIQFCINSINESYNSKKR